MELNDLIHHVPNFAGLSHVDRVKVLAWYLHVHRGKERFVSGDIRQCYVALHLEVPNIPDILASLAKKKPPVFLRNTSEYRLEMKVRQALDAKYSNRPLSIAVEKSLAELPIRLADETKRKYLVEALSCYRSQCYRAAILMTWNLAYDHLLNWVLSDPSRLAKFNAKLPATPPYTNGGVITKREDFERLGEAEVVGIVGHKEVALITPNTKKILIQSLDWRNISAHPNTTEVKQVNTEHVISSLVEEVVLRLN